MFPLMIRENSHPFKIRRVGKMCGRNQYHKLSHCLRGIRLRGTVLKVLLADWQVASGDRQKIKRRAPTASNGLGPADSLYSGALEIGTKCKKLHGSEPIRMRKGKLGSIDFSLIRTCPIQEIRRINPIRTQQVVLSVKNLTRAFVVLLFDTPTLYCTSSKEFPASAFFKKGCRSSILSQ